MTSIMVFQQIIAGTTYIIAAKGEGRTVLVDFGTDARTVVVNTFTTMTAGGEMFFTRGTYIINGLRMDIPSNTSIYAERGAVFRMGVNFSSAIFRCNGVTNVKICDLTFDGDSANQGGAAPDNSCIVYNNSTHIIIRDCYFYDTLFWVLRTAGGCVDLLITGNQIRDFKCAGLPSQYVLIVVWGCDNVRVIANTAWNDTGNFARDFCHCGYNVTTAKGRDIIIAYNVVKRVGKGIESIYGGIEVIIACNIILDSWDSTDGNWVITVTGDSARVARNITIVGNVIESPARDSIVITSYTIATIVAENTVRNGVGVGIWIHGTDTTHRDAEHVLVKGNIVNGGCSHGIVSVYANWVTIEGNELFSCTDQGIEVTDTNYASIIGNKSHDNTDGILIGTLTDDTLVIGNTCASNSGYDIIITSASSNRTRIGPNKLLSTNKISDGGTSTQLPTLILPFIEGGDVTGLPILAQFITAVASAKGWEINAAAEWAIALGQLPLELQQVVRIKIWAVGLAAPGAGNQMRVDFLLNGAQSDEPFNTENADVDSKESNETNFAINDVVSWTFTSADDADIGDLAGGDNIEVRMDYRAAVAPDIATNAVFRCVEIQYI